MAEKNAFNSINKDSMDINELASLNDDISPELIDQLQQKLTQDAQSMGEEKASKISPNFDVNDDTTLFEEPQVNETNTQEPQKPEHTSEKKGFNLEAEAKPEASRSTPASTMAIIAEIEGVFTVIPLKISANWLK